MKKFSSNYCNANFNFIIEGIDDKKETEEYIQAIKIVKNIINRGTPTIMSNYLKNVYNYNIFDDTDYEESEIVSKEKIELTQISRLQMAILELLKNGTLNFREEWNLRVIGVEEKIINLAIEDLKKWFKMIFNLQKENVTIPTHTINLEEKNNIIIDIDIFKIFDEKEYNRNTIYIRNDFDENQQKNYYKVECANKFKYNLDCKNEKDVDNLLEIEKNIFGHQNFRKMQPEIIIKALNSNDTVGILSTGQGKSMCYQLAALLQPGISIVIAPLKALIKDQKDNMHNIYINNNEKIDSTLEKEEQEEILLNFQNGQYQILWVSPERFLNNKFREALQNINTEYNVAYAVIDEVHCMSEWGHSFRPSYLLLVKTIRTYLPNANLIGLTATVSQHVLKDIKVEFNISELDVIKPRNFIREELKFTVINCNVNNQRIILDNLIDELQEKENILDCTAEKPTIVFCNTATYNGCTDLQEATALKYYEFDDNIDFFIGNNKKYDSYQLEMYKEKVQNKFKANQTSMLFATKAFGMGIDKPNIRYVIHYGMPNSIEELFQEVGRAGRDGKQANCYIIHAQNELDKKNNDIIFNSNSTVSEIKEAISYTSYKGMKYYWEKKGDISLQFTLLFNNQEDNEVDNINDFLQERIQKKEETFQFYEKNKDDTVNKIQTKIYKLSILGIISDWTISYDKLVVFNGTWKRLTAEQIRKNLENYIQKYEPEFSFSNLDKKLYNSIIEILNDDSIQNEVYRYIKILCTWYNEKILYNRRIALKNEEEMLNEIENMDDCTDIINDKFRAYFNIDVQKQLEYTSFESALKSLYNVNKLKNISQIKDLKITVGRILEEERTSVPLHLLNGLIRLILNEFDVNRDKEDLQYILDKVRIDQNRKTIYNLILDISTIMEKNSKNILSKMLLLCFTNRDELTQNYKYFNNIEAFIEAMKINLKSLNKIEGDVLNG